MQSKVGVTALQSAQSEKVHADTALIVEGGAMRSVFSCGLLDGLLSFDFQPFERYYGVSAGAFNLAAYLAGYEGLSFSIIRDAVFSGRLIGYRRFLAGGHLLDLDWLESHIFASGLFDPARVFRNNSALVIVATDVVSGSARYLLANPDNLALLIKASASLPMAYRGFPQIAGRDMTDGGVADGTPITEAMRRGAKRIMLIRSRPQGYRKSDTVMHHLIRWKLRRHVRLVETMRRRVALFEEVRALISNPPTSVKIVEICPPEDFTMGRICRQRKQILQGYELGREQAANAIEAWKA